MGFGRLTGNGGFGPFQTSDPGYKQRRAMQAHDAFRGTEAYEGALTEDRKFYNENFVQPNLDLRSIALGMGSGNQFTASERAIADANRSFDAAQGAYGRDVQRVGGISADKAASQQKRLSLGRIISQVDSANFASRDARAQQREASAAGTQLYGDFTSDANQTLRGIALAEMDRDQQYRDAQAAGKRNVAQVSGQVAAMFI